MKWAPRGQTLRFSGPFPDRGDAGVLSALDSGRTATWPISPEPTPRSGRQAEWSSIWPGQALADHQLWFPDCRFPGADVAGLGS